ncbi:MAG TPA: hypothetical protein VK081_01125 [Planctomycetota bacterium]|nr:hypothetical protein [Planctomycetota bacterium]
MLDLILTVVCLAQGHPGDAGALREPAAPMVVRGTVELSAAEADAAAAAFAAQQAREFFAARGREVVGQVAPFWLPDFCRDLLVQRWLGGFDPQAALRIVERERSTHDHGGLGTSYRTTLVVEHDERQVGKQLGRLRRQVPTAARSFAVKCAGIAGFWAVLAFAVAWLDRLSRGYMTWRLRLLGLLAGSVVPGVLLLFP